MKKQILKLSYFLIALLFIPKQAYAMHIMEGFLPLQWSIFWSVMSLPFFILGLRSIRKTVAENPETKMLLALSGAFAFVYQH